MAKIYCEICEDQQPMSIDPMTKDQLKGDAVWGDLCCSSCGLVIATITVEEEGHYDFVKTAKTT